jgi:hypothetical protein
MSDSLNKSDIEFRLRMLEERLAEDRSGRYVASMPMIHPAGICALTLGAVVLGYLALGLPQHYYHYLFSALLLLLLYHRGSLRMAEGMWRWPQVLLSFLLLCLFFKFLIGGGITYPFDWLKLPALTKTAPPVDPSWYSTFVPDYTLQWQPIPKISEWSIDLTKIQTLFLIATFIGALFRFEPFTSITALSLLIISIPAYLHYNWDWTILFLVFGGVALYLQSRMRTYPG